MFGSTGDGYSFARGFGHNVIKTIPILAGVECLGNEFDYLKGVRTKSRLILYKNGEKIFSEDGEIQFTKYGISGICVFNMTRVMRLDKGEHFDDFEIIVDLCPGIDMLPIIEAKAAKGMNAMEILTTITKPELSKCIVEKLGIKNKDDVDDVLDNKLCESLADRLHKLSFIPKNIRKWQEAQCTSGGVDMNELDDLYQSKIQKGLFFVGEVIDYDGPCGGYNLTNAFASGIYAAYGAVGRVD